MLRTAVRRWRGWPICGLLGALVACGGDGTAPTGPSGNPNPPPPPPAAVPASIETAQSSFVLIEGQTSTITVVVRDATGDVISNPQVIWASNSTAIATAAGSGTNGSVTAVGHGQTSIVATAGSFSVEVTVTVARTAAAPTRTWMWADLVSAQSQLWGVWGRSATDLWMVGENQTVVHSNGASFSSLDAPGFSGTLRAVTGSGATTWTVGLDSSGSGGILRYDDRRWTSTTVDAAFPGFWDVWASSSQDVWAVGIGGSTPVWRFDGAEWNAVALPDGGTAVLGVWGTGPSDVWLIGVQRLYHFDGTEVVAVTDPPAGPSLISLWGDAQGTIWTTGELGRVLSYQTDVDRWTDHGPAVAAALSGLPQDLGAVWGSGPNDIWLGGNGGVLVHFDGTTWTQIPNTGFFGVLGIWGAEDRVWALSGFRGGVLVGADPSRFPQPTGSISEILPASQAAGGMVTVHGSGFPIGLDSRQLRVRAGSSTWNAFVFPTPGFSTEMLVRLPTGVPTGSVTLELLDAVGAPVTAPRDFVITSQTATPIIESLAEMTWHPARNGCESLTTKGDSDNVLVLDSDGAFGVHAHGLDSNGIKLRMRQNGNTWTLPAECRHWSLAGGPIGVISRVPTSTQLDDGSQVTLQAGPADIQVRMGDSQWSAARSVTLVLP